MLLLIPFITIIAETLATGAAAGVSLALGKRLIR